MTQTLSTNRFRKAVATEAVIDSVVAGGPCAALAKYKGYRVDRIGSRTVRNLDEAMAAIEALKPDENVEFEVTKDGASQTVSIHTAQLTEQNYTALTNHVFASRSGFELVQQNGHVFIQRQRQPQTRPTSSMRMLQVGAPQKQQPMGQQQTTPQVYGVVAVGIVPDRRADSDAEPDLYRVNTIMDVGVALRLFLMAGGADILVVPPNSEEPSVMRWTLSTDSNVAVRMLIS